jgi:hypothetical protein
MPHVCGERLHILQECIASDGTCPRCAVGVKAHVLGVQCEWWHMSHVSSVSDGTCPMYPVWVMAHVPVKQYEWRTCPRYAVWVTAHAPGVQCEWWHVPEVCSVCAGTCLRYGTCPRYAVWVTLVLCDRHGTLRTLNQYLNYGSVPECQLCHKRFLL